MPKQNIPSNAHVGQIAEQDQNEVSLPQWPIERIIRAAGRLRDENHMVVTANALLQMRGLGRNDVLEQRRAWHMLELRIGLKNSQTHVGWKSVVLYCYLQFFWMEAPIEENFEGGNGRTLALS